MTENLFAGTLNLNKTKIFLKFDSSLWFIGKSIRPLFFYFTDFFLSKLGSEDEIKIKIKFIRTVF